MAAVIQKRILFLILRGALEMAVVELQSFHRFEIEVEAHCPLSVGQDSLIV